MLESCKSIPPCVYPIADNLDAALAAGEDLVASASNWAVGDASDPAVAGAQRWAVSRFKAHELNLVARIVQARQHVSELGKDVQHFRPLAQLFVSATGELADAFGELNEQVDSSFETGGDLMAYLRSRGLIDADVASVSGAKAPEIGDEFLVGGKVPLGICLDLVAEFLDALDLTFDLYPEEGEEPADEVKAIAPPTDAKSSERLGSSV